MDYLNAVILGVILYPGLETTKFITNSYAPRFGGVCFLFRLRLTLNQNIELRPSSLSGLQSTVLNK